MSERHRRPFYKQCLYALPWIVGISALMGLAEWRGWLRGLQNAGLDTVVRHQKTDVSKDIYIVEITDEVYDSVFRSKSPLKAAALDTLLGNVRAAVGDAGVVGVDIDTSDESFRTLREKYLHDQRIVWAWVPERMPQLNGEGEVEVGPFRKVLGEAWAPPLLVGVPLFPVEADGAIRKYRRTFNQDNVYSFGWQVVHTWRGDELKGAREVYFNFRGDRTKFPVIEATQFLEHYQQGDAAKVMSGKIALIGGSYAAARDEYATAEGRMAGVELIAHAIDADLTNKGIREFSWLQALPFDVLLGLFVVAGFHFIPWIRVAFWVTLVGSAVLSVLGSFWAFGTEGYWVDFVPVLVGMMLHQLLDHAERHRDLQHEVKTLKHELRAARAAARRE